MADLFQEMELIQLIMWILGISKMWSIPWEFGFEVFHEFLKMRGLDSQSWVFDSQNHLMSTRNSSYQWFMKTLNLSSLFLNENFILIWSIMNKSITAIILDFQKSRNSDFLQNHVRVHHAVKFLILLLNEPKLNFLSRSINLSYIWRRFYKDWHKEKTDFSKTN